MRNLNIILGAALLIGCASGEIENSEVAPSFGEANVDTSANNVATDTDERESVENSEVVIQNDEEQQQQRTNLNAALNAMVPSTRLLVKITKNGDMEVISAVETRGHGRVKSTVGDYVFHADVDGKTISAGAFDDPFTLISANYTDDGRGNIIEQDEAVVLMNLPGVSLKNSGFQLTVEKLTQNPYIDTVSSENVTDVLRRGGATAFGNIKASKISEALCIGKVTRDLRTDILTDIESLSSASPK